MTPVAVIISGVFILSCNFNQTDKRAHANYVLGAAGKNDSSYPTISAIPVPAGYKRISNDKSSFGSWLGAVKMKKDKTVHLYNGAVKQNQLAQFAVLDISVGNQDLQQCADAVMRLRAEYLFQEKKFNEITFSDNDGKNYSFHEPFTADNFHHYLNSVFAACGTASLSKQLHSKAFKNLQTGDVLIRGGFPGHAVLVMDAAVNDKDEVIYLLAQSYMPAQDIHILVNPLQADLSPWYKVDGSSKIITPEYVFHNNELKEW